MNSKIKYMIIGAVILIVANVVASFIETKFLATYKITPK